MSKKLSETSQLLGNTGPTTGEVIFKVSAVSLFVGLGAGQVLAAKASVGPDGALPYDSAAAVFWVEAIKFSISLVWMLTMDRSQFVWPIPRSWYSLCLDLSMVALLFTATNELNFMVIEHLGASLFAILSNLKIVFTCLFMRVMLGKVFSNMQWVGVVLLTSSAVVVKWPVFVDASKSLPSTFLIGLTLLLVSTACSGLASVKNESILKAADPAGQEMSFMMKNAVLYVWGMVLNFGSWAFMGSKGLTEGLNTNALLSIFLLVGLGLSCAVILCYLDNVARCFGSVAQVLLTVAASQAIFASSDASDFGIYYIVSLALLAVALVVYQAHDSPNLVPYAALAGLIAGSVGLACTHMSQAP